MVWCHHPRKRVIQYSRAPVIEPRSCGVGSYPAFAGYDGELSAAKKIAKKEKCEAANAAEVLDPGVPYESRWAPYDRVHGPGQGQFPKGSIRPRGYYDFRRAPQPRLCNVATSEPNRQRSGTADSMSMQEQGPYFDPCLPGPALAVGILDFPYPPQLAGFAVIVRAMGFNLARDSLMIPAWGSSIQLASERSCFATTVGAAFNRLRWSRSGQPLSSPRVSRTGMDYAR